MSYINTPYAYRESEDIFYNDLLFTVGELIVSV